MSETIGMVAGSFDPVTRGHINVMEQALKIVDRLVILLASNPEKKYQSAEKDRRNMLVHSIAEHFGSDAIFKDIITIKNLPNDEFAVRAARDVGAKIMFRGLRNVIDFEYEHGIQDVNRIIAPEITTIFLMPPPELVAVSSSMIRGMIGIQGWQQVAVKYVPHAVVHHFESKQ